MLGHFFVKFLCRHVGTRKAENRLQRRSCGQSWHRRHRRWMNTYRGWFLTATCLGCRSTNTLMQWQVVDLICCEICNSHGRNTDSNIVYNLSHRLFEPRIIIRIAPRHVGRVLGGLMTSSSWLRRWWSPFYIRRRHDFFTFLTVHVPSGNSLEGKIMELPQRIIYLKNPHQILFR